MALVSGMVGDLAERHGAPSRGPERLLGCVWVGREGRSRGGVFGLMIETGRRARPRAVLGLGPPFRLRPAAVASQPIGATGGVCPPSLKRAPGCPEVPNAAAEGSHTTFRAAARQAGVGAALRGTQSRAVACIKGPGRLCPGRRAQPLPYPGEGSWLLRARAAGEQTLAAQRRQVACARGRGGGGIHSLLAPPGARRVATHRPGRQARTRAHTHSTRRLPQNGNLCFAAPWDRSLGLRFRWAGPIPCHSRSATPYVRASKP